MSEYVPFEIQEEIMKKLPVKSLIQFRSVSKAWKSLIDSSEFIAAHAVGHSQPHHLLVSYEDPVTLEGKYVSFVDDDTFPQQNFAPNVPLCVEKLYKPTVIGSSHGLLCLYGDYVDSSPHHIIMDEMIVLWNPSIKKSIAVSGSWVYDAVGFGVCQVTGDPKIVTIPQIYNQLIKRKQIKKPCEVKVYTVSSGEWRSVFTNLPGQSIEVTRSQVVTDGFNYWLAFNTSSMDGELKRCPLILSFDTTNEKLRVVDLPDSLTQPHKSLTVSKVWESLAVLEYGLDEFRIDDQPICTVWIMEDGVPNSFTKHFTFKTPDTPIMNVLGTRKTGEPVIETYDYDDEYASVVVCEHRSEDVHDIGINATYDSFSVNSYKETLLLLDQ